jgi:hypothetical protein
VFHLPRRIVVSVKQKGGFRIAPHFRHADENAKVVMGKQLKGTLCACGYGRRKTNPSADFALRRGDVGTASPGLQIRDTVGAQAGPLSARLLIRSGDHCETKAALVRSTHAEAKMPARRSVFFAKRTADRLNHNCTKYGGEETGSSPPLIRSGQPHRSSP